MDHTERIEKTLSLAHRKGCMFASLVADGETLNQWSLEGIESTDLTPLATEIHEFCEADVDASGSKTNYQIACSKDAESETLIKSPRLAYVPSEGNDMTPTDDRSYSKALMQNTIAMVRVFGTSVPTMLDANMRMTRELLEHVRETDKNRLDAAKLLEKARSKEHKREMKKIEQIAFEGYREKVIDQALPHLPRVIGGIMNFAGMKALPSPSNEGEDTVTEEQKKTEDFRAAFLSLKNSERIAIESRIPGMLDHVGEILSRPASEANLDALMNYLVDNQFEKIRLLEEILGSERLESFKQKAGF